MADDTPRKNAREFITNKRGRSLFFMLMSFTIILAINSTLPLIQGESHYTVATVEVTYEEFVAMKETNPHYTLTYMSEMRMELYIQEYLNEYPDLTPEERILVEVPDNFKVNVNTQFFFEYPFWYISTGVSLLSSVLLFYSLFNFLIVREKDKYKKYVDLDEEIQTMNDKKLDPTTFEPWMENVFNYQRKLDQHESNVKYSIDKLDRKTHYKHKYRLKKYFYATTDKERADELITLGKLSRKELKYKRKRERLLVLLEEEYMLTYVPNSRVKYFKHIYPMFVYNGTNTVGRSTDGYSQIASDGSRLANDAGAKIIFSLSITLIFSTLFTVTVISSVGQSALWIIINIIAKVAPLLIQIPLAFDYNTTFMDNHLMVNKRHQRSIGLRYMADMTKGVSVEPVVYKKKEVDVDARENITRDGPKDPEGSRDGAQEQGHSQAL